MVIFNIYISIVLLFQNGQGECCLFRKDFITCCGLVRKEGKLFSSIKSRDDERILRYVSRLEIVMNELQKLWMLADFFENSSHIISRCSEV